MGGFERVHIDRLFTKCIIETVMTAVPEGQEHTPPGKDSYRSEMSNILVNFSPSKANDEMQFIIKISKDI